MAAASGGIGWGSAVGSGFRGACSRSARRMMAVEVGVCWQKRDSTAFRCTTSRTAISKIQLSSPVTS